MYWVYYYQGSLINLWNRMCFATDSSMESSVTVWLRCDTAISFGEGTLNFDFESLNFDFDFDGNVESWWRRMGLQVRGENGDEWVREGIKVKKVFCICSDCTGDSKAEIELVWRRSYDSDRIA